MLLRQAFRQRARLGAAFVASGTAVWAAQRQQAASVRCEGGDGPGDFPREAMDGNEWRPPFLRGANRKYKPVRRLSERDDPTVSYEYQDLRNKKRVVVNFHRHGTVPQERQGFETWRSINPKCSYEYNMPPAYELIELPRSADVSGRIATIWGWGGEEMLFKRMQTMPRLTPENTDNVLECITHGLATLHAKKWVHCNVNTQSTTCTIRAGHDENENRKIATLEGPGACLREIGIDWMCEFICG